MLKKLAPFIFLFAFGTAQAAVLEIPRNLGSDDRKSALEILGYGAQVRLLSSPAPLGGRGDHQGFEVGLSSEAIPLGRLGELGSRSNASGDYDYLNLSFAKGLPYNVDTFVQFTPIPQTGGAFGYGAQLRWGFYEFDDFPGVVSLVIQGGGMNYNDQLSVRTTGADLVFTYKWRDLAAFVGGGTIRTMGTFYGGTNGVTADGATREEDINTLHSVVGFNYDFAKFFVALEGDHAVGSTYAGRIGFRF